MKHRLIMENWRKFLNESNNLTDVLVVDKNNPPSSGDPTLDGLIKSVLDGLTDKELTPRFRKERTQGCNPLTGHCFLATEAIWSLIRELNNEEYYYIPCHFRAHDFPEIGPHWFLKDYNTGHIIDLTFGQFPPEVMVNGHLPYDHPKVKCDYKVKDKWKYAATALMMHRPKKTENSSGQYPEGTDRHKVPPTARTQKFLKKIKNKKQ